MSERSPDTASGAVALGLLCSAAATLPALARVLSGGDAARAIFALWAAASLVVVPLGLWLRRAISAGLPPGDRALLAGVALSALPLALCGGVLKSTTHHRPLGGATFAVVSLGILALCIGLAWRILRPTAPGSAESRGSAWQNLFLLGCGLSLLALVTLGAARAARPNLVDFSALVGAAAVVAGVKLPSWLGRLKLWPLLLGWVVLLGCASLALKSPQLVRSLTTQAPVSFAPLSWLGGGS